MGFTVHMRGAHSKTADSLNLVRPSPKLGNDWAGWQVALIQLSSGNFSTMTNGISAIC